MAEPDNLPVGPRVSWTPAEPPGRDPLDGEHVLLRPLHAADAEELFAATHPPRGDPSVWTYMSDGPYADVADLRRGLIAAEASEDPLFFAVVHDGQVLGRASYLRITPAFGVIEIGNLLFARALQRTTATPSMTSATAVWSGSATRSTPSPAVPPIGSASPSRASSARTRSSRAVTVTPPGTRSWTPTGR
jgi:hypothetical protein